MKLSILLIGFFILCSVLIQLAFFIEKKFTLAKAEQQILYTIEPHKRRDFMRMCLNKNSNILMEETHGVQKLTCIPHKK